MEGYRLSQVESLLYDYPSDKVRAFISQTDDPEVLYAYAYNYNWDNGFEIPQSILDNEKCDLSIALLVFHRADGVSYLLDKSGNESLPQWSSFIENLYNSILDNKYQRGEIAFKAPLSKVQMHKLKKQLTGQEHIFIESIEGKNIDIDL